MSQSHAAIPAGKLKEYDRPVLHSSGGDQIWHIPMKENGKARFACQRSETVFVASLTNFRRRRNQRMCRMCAQETGCNEYPEDAPLSAGDLE